MGYFWRRFLSISYLDRNEYEGTGRALAVVRKITLYHGDDVTANSKPGAIPFLV
jgi:signal transduction histidine kinase